MNTIIIVTYFPSERSSWTIDVSHTKRRDVILFDTSLLCKVLFLFPLLSIVSLADSEQHFNKQHCHWLSSSSSSSRWWMAATRRSYGTDWQFICLPRLNSQALLVRTLYITCIIRFIFPSSALMDSTFLLRNFHNTKGLFRWPSWYPGPRNQQRSWSPENVFSGGFQNHIYAPDVAI